MNLNYSLHSNSFVFCSLDSSPFAEEDVLMSFREGEGMTYIVSEQTAQAAGVDFKERWAWITVNTVTALNATGITAHISAALAAYKIPCNMVAAFYHDHLFVPFDSAEAALRALRA